jgi:single-stranded-DNA-specific exonuclease
LALLLSDSPDAALPLARRLQQLNTARQHAEKSILEDIQAHLATHPRLLENKSLVLAQEGWHAGILGIVASRVAKQFHRPVVLISTDGNMGQGSGRSIAGLDLYSALKSCRQALIAFGGHAMAAGLRIQTDHIADFQQALETTIQAMAADSDRPPDLAIDCELDLGNIDSPLIDAIQALQPFGVAIPKPLFMARNVRVCSSKIVGSGHRRMVLSPSAPSRNIRLDAIQFNVGQDKALPKRFARIAFELQWNRWNGNKKAQLVVAAADPAK